MISSSIYKTNNLNDLNKPHSKSIDDLSIRLNLLSIEDDRLCADQIHLTELLKIKNQNLPGVLLFKSYRILSSLKYGGIKYK